MNATEFKARLRAGQSVYGTLLVSTSPRYPAEVAKIGLDFVFIDTEHIAIDRGLLSWMCQTYRGYGLTPIVRIPAPDPYQACMVLDGGAGGVIAPYVETAAQARALVGAVKYRPLKGRKLEGFLSGQERLEPELQAYLDKNNAANSLILNIESMPAIAALDEILAVPGVDGVLIGPHDLSCSAGVPERYDAPEFNMAVRTIFSKARAKGVGAGIHAWMGVDRAAEFAKAGANLIVHEADIISFRDNVRKDVARLRGLAGEKVGAGDHSAVNI
jgi:2-keto-3-deoxy-L-rhamnonate aldolase RhmA